jgi:NAD+ diphosphatase
VQLLFGCETAAPGRGSAGLRARATLTRVRYIARVSFGQQLFAGPFIERRAELRDDPQWLAAARADPDTRYVLAAGGAQLVVVPSVDIALLRNGDPLVAGADESSFTLLGWFRGARTVLVEIGPDVPPMQALPEATELRELRPLAPLLQADAASLLAYARALVVWRSRHRFCGVCGAPNLRARAGHVMRCSRESCATETFPRLDPAIIVLVADATDERALLGRQASWPAGRYSTIAGFVEPGESLEDAVLREVEEETGVHVGDVEYVASQPWPFPSSLMLGFRAVARTEAISLRDGELEDARWFTRADVAAGHPALPPTGSISARLIDGWFRAAPTPAGGPPRRW